MEKEIEDILKRYYEGESTLEEERWLKESFHKGELKEEPVLAYQHIAKEMPDELPGEIQARIHRKAVHSLRYRRLLVTGIAATFVLLISLRGFIFSPEVPPVPLSDHLKKERFEDALRIIGQALEEKQPPVQKVLYEDSKFIICVE